jgi:hypothetical protein
MIFFHSKLIKFIFGVGFGIERAEMFIEGVHEDVVVGCPVGDCVWVHERGFEKVQSRASEVRECEVNFVLIVLKGVGSVSEIELELD